LTERVGTSHKVLMVGLYTSSMCWKGFPSPASSGRFFASQFQVDSSMSGTDGAIAAAAAEGGMIKYGIKTLWGGSNYLTTFPRHKCRRPLRHRRGRRRYRNLPKRQPLSAVYCQRAITIPTHPRARQRGIWWSVICIFFSNSTPHCLPPLFSTQRNFKGMH
jgi:hypothetical protein